MNWLGDYPEDFASVAVFFTTHDSNGAPVAPLSAFEADDVKIYKNGDAAQKTTTNGLTMTSPFDSITGLHRLLIDTSVNTGDTGFWTAGAVYSVVLNPDTETVNGEVVVKVIGTFGLKLAPFLLSSDYTAPPSAATVAAAVWAEIMEGTWSAIEFMRLFAAALAGKASGLGTATATYRDIDDTKDRLVATVDANGNRSAVTPDGS